MGYDMLRPHMPKSTLFIEPISDRRGLRLSGELDASNVFSLTEPLEELVRADADLTIDLSDLGFIDSAGIHLLIRSAKALEGRGTMVVVCPEGAVRKVLLLVGFPGAFTHVRLEPSTGPSDAESRTA